MDFNYTEDQLAIKDVADRIYRDLGSDEQIKECFTQSQPFHQSMWQQLANSGLLAAPLAEAYGGSGMGLTELCLVIEGQGKTVSPMPMIDTVVECAMPIEQFASAEMKQRLLPGVATGEIKLSFVRPYDGLMARKPLTVVKKENAWVLNGCSASVRYAGLANGFLISASTNDGTDWVGYCDAAFSDAKDGGITLHRQKATSGEASGYLEFNNVEIEAASTIAVAEEASRLLVWREQRVFVAIAAQQVGILSEGLKRAAEYTNERTQFGKPLSSFQAVAQQAADAYMAIEALRGVYWRALDDIDRGRDASLSAHVAKFWVAEAGHIAAHIYLHIHGGIGQDLDYPLHRFFTWAKNNEGYLGGANHHAATLGAMISANPEQVAV